MNATEKEQQADEVEIVVIAGDRVKDQFMHAADVFEPFKVLADVHTISFTTKKAPIDLPKVIGAIVKGVQPNWRVVAAFAPNRKEGAYVDPTVRVISNGTNWAMLDDVLKVCHYLPQDACESKLLGSQSKMAMLDDASFTTEAPK